MSKEDENDKDLDFWMDSKSNSDINDISDDDAQIEAAMSPSQKKKSKKQKNSPNLKTRKHKRAVINSDEDEDEDDDVVIQEVPSWNTLPKEFTGEMMPFINAYEPPISKSRESQALELAVESLKNDINKMLRADDDDDDIMPVPAPSAPVLKKEGDLTLIFVYPPDDFQEERILKAGQPFITAFQSLPEKYEDFSVQIDGLEHNPKEVLNDLLDDYTKVILTKPDQSSSLDGLKKLAIVLPSGEKKKIAVDPNSTFKEFLDKLNIPNAKLMFDGEDIPLNQKIADNDDIEDGDQIDVCLC